MMSATHSGKCLLVVIGLIGLLVSKASASDVRVLTDASFEHDTQAITGATTGDWLVEFYAPWCGHCKKLAPVWELVATELSGTVNVASVDCTENTVTAKRFNVRGYPTIKFIKAGKVYDYNGDRSQKSLVDFALTGYSNSKVVSQPVPAVPTFFDVLQSSVLQYVNDVKQVVTNQPIPSLTLFMCGLLVGILIATTMFIFVEPATRPPTQHRAPPPPTQPAAQPPTVDGNVKTSSSVSTSDRELRQRNVASH